MDVQESSHPAVVGERSPRRQRLLAVAVVLAVLLLATVVQGCVVSVERSVKLGSYALGTPASTIIAEMGPADADHVPSADQRRHLGPRVARLLFYDTAPWWDPFLSGVDLEFDDDDRLLRTWNVME